MLPIGFGAGILRVWLLQRTVFYADGRGRENVRLAFSMVDESLIDEDIERLSSLLA
jgi:DNA-binding transcriptional MocR family regulator